MAAQVHKWQGQQEAPQPINLSKAILRIQSALLDLPSCAERQILAAGSVLSRPDYGDIITERCIVGLCGYPLCANQLPSERSRRGRYRISLSQHRVYDLQETYSFCSEECLISSRAFAGTLPEERCSDLSHTRIAQALALFEGDEGKQESVSQVLSVQEKKKGDSLDDGDLGLAKLTIWEKTDVSSGNTSLQDWAGPANAIEGYVPQRERENGSARKVKANPQSSKLSATRNTDFVEFTSEIISGDDLLPFHPNDFSTSSHSNSVDKSARSISNELATKVDLVSSDDIISQDVSRVSCENIYTFLSDLMDSQLGTSKGGQNQRSDELVNGQIVKSSLKLTGRKNQHRTVKWADEDGGINSLAKDAESQGCHGQAKGQKLKSSLKLSGKNAQIRTLKWTDKDGGNPPLAQDSKSVGQPCLLKEIKLDQLATVEGSTAVPPLVTRVAEFQYDVEDTESDVGTTKLVPPPTAQALESHAETYQVDSICQGEMLKWPKKSLLSESKMFEVAESLHDAPPEGFSLTLSTFATVWMALFGWISCSSIAYIYGKSEESWEEFSCIEGREYPRRTSFTDGRSLEIKQTLASCLERCLPQVVLDLRLQTSVSVIEKEMGQLLETMSFMDPIPPFKTREWHVILLLFMDALSVSRIPALARHMVDNQALSGKVLDAAKVGKDEYETMKDLLLPLGRTAQLSMKRAA